MDLKDAIPATMPRGLTDHVYESLKTAILNGSFPPREQLSAEELADHFQVSLTPVRDAFKRLEADRLVKIRPRRGVFVSDVTASEIHEIFEIRRMIESAAVEKYSQDSGDVLVRLQEIVTNMEALWHGETFQEYPHYIQLDTEFHNCIVSIPDNSRLINLYEELRWPIHLVLVFSNVEYHRASETLSEHKTIVRALKDGKISRAQDVLVTHLQNAEDDLLRRLPSRSED